ncbi:DUF982 domain-containing protein [Mesorhizobium carmichaelinearum]|uniref:DUF982 domain-containing protein n=1 Tax=Mesorhizobium carmichaelinearum TaxID=1208188 RepID=UPI000BA39559|nr:DUF982 domain-containing protein [Mesorhizobium carmichaelinearum]
MTVLKTPVTVIIGIGFPTKIESVREALALLDEWPPSKRNAAHTIACNACRAAILGEVDAETARSMFVAFAQRNDLLAPEIDGVLAVRQVGMPTHGDRARGTT